ncbi:carbamate kinase, partial [bacterium]|nr:carbamate kinase [bacterium]
MEDSENPCAVVALGGNALSPPSQSVTVQEQFRHTRQSLRGLISLLKENYEIAVVHGNGPQVGVALLRVELSKDVLPDIPLGMLVADTEGSIGYMIEQSFQNLLTKENIDRSVATLITQVIVDENDPSLKTPTKFIGRIYSHTEAQQKMKKNKWEMLKFNEKGNWRRVVGSPKPLEIVNSTTLKTMVKSGTITIVAGGGGIPVYNHPEYGLDGIDAVIDKDLAAALVGQVIKA